MLLFENNELKNTTNVQTEYAFKYILKRLF